MPQDIRKYPITDFATGLVEDELVATLRANALLKAKFDGIETGDDGSGAREVRVVFSATLIASEVTELDGDTSPPAAGSVLGDHAGLPLALEQAKRAKNKTIDQRTRELISGGFTHNNKKFSLSPAAQRSLNFIFAIRADLTYPLKWNTRNDGDTESFAGAPEFKTFYLAAVTAKRGHRDSGTALKDSVRAATTVAEVDAIIDNR